MFNRSGIKIEQAMTPNDILFNVQNQMAVGVQVASSVGTVSEGGKTIAKAGTPLTGDLMARDTAFTAAGADNAVGVLLHDVDVTNGTGNGSLLIWGFVNVNRLEEDVQTKITDGVKTSLKGAIWFLKD